MREANERTTGWINVETGASRKKANGHGRGSDLIQLVVRSFASLTYAPKGASKMLRATRAMRAW